MNSVICPLQTQAKKSKVKFLRAMKIMFLSSFVSVLFMTIIAYDFPANVWLPYGADPVSCIIISNLGALASGFAGVLSPVFIICGLFPMSLLDDLSFLVDEWTLGLKNKDNNNNNNESGKKENVVAKEQITEVKEFCLKLHLKMGLEIQDIVQRTCSSMQKLFIIHLATNMSVAITALFIATAVLFGKPTLMFISFSMAFITIELASVYFYRLICSYGEKLEDARKRASFAADDLILADSTATHELPAIVSKRFLEKDILAPYGFFNVNNSHFINAFTIGYTYAIVLMQFKLT